MPFLSANECARLKTQSSFFSLYCRVQTDGPKNTSSRAQFRNGSWSCYQSHCEAGLRTVKQLWLQYSQSFLSPQTINAFTLKDLEHFQQSNSEMGIFHMCPGPHCSSVIKHTESTPARVKRCGGGDCKGFKSLLSATHSSLSPSTGNSAYKRVSAIKKKSTVKSTIVM